MKVKILDVEVEYSQKNNKSNSDKQTINIFKNCLAVSGLAGFCHGVCDGSNTPIDKYGVDTLLKYTPTLITGIIMNYQFSNLLNKGVNNKLEELVEEESQTFPEFKPREIQIDEKTTLETKVSKRVLTDELRNELKDELNNFKAYKLGINTVKGFGAVMTTSSAAITTSLGYGLGYGIGYILK
jgi:hypothetical protein